jgi:hypothetical protein
MRRSSVVKFLYEFVLQKANTVLRRVGRRSGNKTLNVQISIIINLCEYAYP